MCFFPDMLHVLYTRKWQTIILQFEAIWIGDKLGMHQSVVVTCEEGGHVRCSC